MNWILGGALALNLMLNAAGPPAPEEVMELPPELSELLDQKVLLRASSAEGLQQLLVDFLFSSSGLNFKYEVEPTRSVADTFQSRKGNCLSFTLLFIALAREAGLEAYPREVNAPLSWRRQENTVFRTGHVNVDLRVANQRLIVDFEPDFLLAHRLAAPFRGRIISDQRALAHFYNNRGAELLANGDLEQALGFLDKALELEPAFTPAMNNRGVLLRRLGDPEAAEQSFLAALDQDAENANALFNLHALYRHTGNRSELESLRARLDATRLQDPYFQYELGRLHEDQGDYRQAHRHYQRAIRLSDQEHRFHFAVARVKYQTGDLRGAEQAFENAIERSRTDSRREYTAKLHALRESSPEHAFQ